MQYPIAIPATYMNAGKKVFTKGGRDTNKRYTCVGLALGNLVVNETWQIDYGDETGYTVTQVGGIFHARIARVFPEKGFNGEPLPLSPDVHRVNWPEIGRPKPINMRFQLYHLPETKERPSITGYVHLMRDGSIELDVPLDFEYDDPYQGESEINRQRRLLLAARNAAA